MLENIPVQYIHTSVKMQGIPLWIHSAFLQDLLHNQSPVAYSSNLAQNY